MVDRLPCLLSLGVHRPAKVVSSSTLEIALALDEGWVERRTGVVERRYTTTGLEHMALEAARSAVEACAIRPEEIDLVLFATESSLSQSPPIAPSLASRLGATGAGGFDLVAACAGFTYGLAVAADFVACGTADTVLVVAAEEISAWLEPTDPTTSVVFGDGAGAAVVSLASKRSIWPSATLSNGSLSHLIGTNPPSWVDAFAETPARWPRLRMNGPEVYRWAITSLPGLVARALDAAGLTPADIDVFVPHQANLRIITEVARRCGFEGAVVADDVRVSGNTSSASIPLAAVALLESGRARPGQTAVFAGFGAGMTACAQVVTLPEHW